MKVNVAKSHIRKPDGSSYKCMDVCRFNNGKHTCCSSSKNSDMYKYGIGISLYFKFVKNMICFFFFCTLLSAPMVVFNYRAAVESSVVAIDTYKKAFSATTIGSLGLDIGKCEMFNGEQAFSIGVGDKSIDMNCHTGTLKNNWVLFGYSFICSHFSKERTSKTGNWLRFNKRC